MSGSRHAGAIPLGAASRGEDAATVARVEVARVGVADGGVAAVLIGQGVPDDAERFGALAADTIGHAPRTPVAATADGDERGAALIRRTVARAGEAGGGLDPGGRRN